MFFLRINTDLLRINTDLLRIVKTVTPLLIGPRLLCVFDVFKHPFIPVLEVFDVKITDYSVKTPTLRKGEW